MKEKEYLITQSAFVLYSLHLSMGILILSSGIKLLYMRNFPMAILGILISLIIIIFAGRNFLQRRIK